MSERFVVFDLETTGLHPQRGDRIIEIGAISLEDNKPGQIFQSLINSGRHITIAAQNVHGINSDMLADQPTPVEVMKRFQAFISDSTLIAHNAKFDVRFLRHEFSRFGLSLKNKSFCTLELSRKHFPRLSDYKLETVYRHVTGCSAEKLRVHRALCDAGLVARIWMNFGVASMDR